MPIIHDFSKITFKSYLEFKEIIEVKYQALKAFEFGIEYTQSVLDLYADGTKRIDNDRFDLGAFIDSLSEEQYTEYLTLVNDYVQAKKDAVFHLIEANKLGIDTTDIIEFGGIDGYIEQFYFELNSYANADEKDVEKLSTSLTVSKVISFLDTTEAAELMVANSNSEFTIGLNIAAIFYLDDLPLQKQKRAEAIEKWLIANYDTFTLSKYLAVRFFFIIQLTEYLRGTNVPTNLIVMIQAIQGNTSTSTQNNQM